MTASKIRILLILISLPVQVLVVQYISGHPEWVERYFTNGFYSVLSKILRSFFGLFSFPLGQFLFYGAIFLISFWLFRQIQKMWQKKISIKQFTFHIGITAVLFFSWFYFLFTSMWGLNYHRVPVQQITNISDQPFTKKELEKLCARLIQLTNESRGEITSDTTQALTFNQDKKELLQQASLGYTVAAQKFPKFTYSKPAVKAVLIPELMSYFGIGGIYFPFTGEANVNMDPPEFLLPETICHEMAHQIGFASEDEANYVAYVVCRMHPEATFQYSGNLTALKYAMNRMAMQDTIIFKNLKTQINPGVINDLKKNREYWESFQNPIEVVGEFIHDLFLKANDQQEGIQSYSRVVELLMGEYRKNGLVYDDKENIRKPN